MAGGDDLPEEFCEDFDRITLLLQAQFDDLVAEIVGTVASVAHLSDKELGPIIGT
ncbi:MAG TPA: hypothetical protein VGV37_25840 [Aliidongia sp.]|uniref:hypothetical protein n=1 Tax=Aliidongia sp. TaxID=1914230 RepID=UPI002DDD6A40|nr:hypothetical protein [Aliidongia sp.]HEV2677980.1 hypothetical protein [Aliidongia sp.]